jgi:hypothetical protein
MHNTAMPSNFKIYSSFKYFAYFFIGLAAGCGGSGGGNSNNDDLSPAKQAIVSTRSTGLGEITPKSTTKNIGEIANFTLIPQQGYKVDSITGCSGNLKSNIYSTSELVDDCEIQVTFSPAFYELTTQTDGNGTFEFTKVQVLGQARLGITPNPGFIIDQVTGCGGKWDGTTYLTPILTEDCLVIASFKRASILEVSANNSKTLLLSWSETPSASHYNLLISTTEQQDFKPLAKKIEKNVGKYEYTSALHLISNISFKLEVCTDEECTDSNIASFENNYSDVITHIKASNPNTLDYFGTRLELSADGNTLAVASLTEKSNAKGINGDQQDNSIRNAGAVYIFSRSGTSWQQEAYIKASNTDQWDVFGSSIALSADGSILAVGAPEEDSRSTQINGDQEDNSWPEIGAAYVFKRTNKTWTQQAYLKASQLPSEPRRIMNFGTSIAMNSDGNQIAVGSKWGQTNSVPGGIVHIFEYKNDAWIEKHALSASNVESSDQFGKYIEMSADGNTIAIGAPDEDSANNDQSDNSKWSAGATYIYKKSNNVWSQTAYLKASTPTEESYFGSNISLSGNGMTLAVGVQSESSTGENNQNSSSLSRSGAVYIFKLINEDWKQVQLIKTENKEQSDIFGMSVSLNHNGKILAVGAPGEDGGDSGFNGDQSSNEVDSAGAAYIFISESNNFSQKTYIKSKKAIPSTGLGSSISISADGNSLAVGAPFDDSNAIGINESVEKNERRDSGAVFVY